MKKIILIWDFDGAIGQINSSFPYNFNFSNLETEINNVRCSLDILDKYKIKCCFAITGFSAEEGIYPYSFPELIKEISDRGHEIASHSWKHEWSSIFQKKQIEKSLIRSKHILELTTRSSVIGFVPPHNRPMTWLRKGAFSLGDRGIYPLFKMADNKNIIALLMKTNYKWIRISYSNIFHKLKLSKKNITGKIYNHKNILILENHYTGFDKTVVDHILKTNHKTYTISAHPLMLSFENKTESLKNFEVFLETLSSEKNITFIRPCDLL